MVAGAALRQYVEERIRRRDPYPAQNIDAATQERIGEQTNRRTDHNHASIRATECEQVLQRIVQQRGAGK